MRSLLHTFDSKVTQSVQSWPQWVHPVMIVITSLGHPIVTVGVALIIVATGWMRLDIRLMAAGAVAAGVIGVGALMKLALQRARPLTDYVLHMRFDSFSFPSGHATGATVVFGLLAYLAWQVLPQPWGGICLGALTLLIILIGISRVYLGAHYPSDVIGGWLLGAVGLIIIIFVVQPKI